MCKGLNMELPNSLCCRAAQRSAPHLPKTGPGHTIAKTGRTELVGTAGQQATACPDSKVAYINHPGAAIVHKRLIRQPALLAAQLLAAAVTSSVAMSSMSSCT